MMLRKLKTKMRLFNKVVVLGLCFALVLVSSIQSVGYADAGKDQKVGLSDNETVSEDQSNNG